MFLKCSFRKEKRPVFEKTIKMLEGYLQVAASDIRAAAENCGTVMAVRFILNFVHPPKINKS
jgi:hypothetical protein